MNNYIKTVSLIFLFLNFISCNNATPSGFWKNFHSDKIVDKFSDNGPWGGKTKISWEFKNSIKEKELLEFASSNGWIFNDEIILNSDNLNEENYSDEILKSNISTNSKYKNNTIYKFKTGWIAVKAGNQSETEINGFAILNSNRTKLTVFHIWGE